MRFVGFYRFFHNIQLYCSFGVTPSRTRLSAKRLKIVENVHPDFGTAIDWRKPSHAR